jgi:hypothetical protein
MDTSLMNTWIEHTYKIFILLILINQHQEEELLQHGYEARFFYQLS